MNIIYFYLTIFKWVTITKEFYVTTTFLTEYCPNKSWKCYRKAALELTIVITKMTTIITFLSTKKILSPNTRESTPSTRILPWGWCSKSNYRWRTNKYHTFSHNSSIEIDSWMLKFTEFNLNISSKTKESCQNWDTPELKLSKLKVKYLWSNRPFTKWNSSALEWSLNQFIWDLKIFLRKSCLRANG